MTETVSAIVLTYNQQDFVSEGLKSIFEQNCDGLEIVISDDASSDNTVEVLNREIDAYRGPHKVILNTNEKNLGIFENFVKAASLSSGGVLVACAGDDISYPDRIKTIKTMFGDNKNIFAVHSSVDVFNNWGSIVGKMCRPYGNDLKEVVRCRQYFLGASAAYRREVFDCFPDFFRGLFNEDIILPARALMLGGRVDFLSRPLVKYRAGASQWKGGGGIMDRAKRKNGYLRILAYQQLLLDLDCRKNSVTDYAATKEFAIKNIKEDQFFVDLIELNFSNVLLGIFDMRYAFQHAKAAARVLRLVFNRRRLSAGGGR